MDKDKFKQALEKLITEPEEWSVSDLAQEAGFDLKDPRISMLINKHFDNQEAAEFAIARMRTYADRHSPDEASRASPVGKPPRNLSKQERLLAEYEKRKKNLRGNDLIELKIEMQKKGLNIT